MSSQGKYFIAIDLGASHGSIITGQLRDKRLVLHESHRFIHGIVEKEGVKRWDWDFIGDQIRKGLHKACQDTGEGMVESVSCSSWAQDFGLLNTRGEIFYKPVSYRDNRTGGLPDKFFDVISPRDLFHRNGSVISSITTLCQLYSMVQGEAGYLSGADKFLFIADLVHYMLCGKASTDWTFATASQMVNLRTGKWDLELAGKLGIPPGIYPRLNVTPQVTGSAKAPDIHPKLSGVPVISGSGHDTAMASSVVLPIHDKTVFLSLGTWAMLGCYDKGIGPGTLEMIDDYSISALGLPWGKLGLFCSSVGLWLIQECVRQWSEKGIDITYRELAEKASHSNINSIIPPNDKRFFSPDDMTGEIINYCKETGQAVPVSPEDFAKVIFDSLALEFKALIGKLERASGVKFRKIQVVSGGSKNRYLCSRIARLAGIPLVAGPAEATAIGNILLQARVLNLLGDSSQAGEVINNSFSVNTFNT